MAPRDRSRLFLLGFAAGALLGLAAARALAGAEAASQRLASFGPGLAPRLSARVLTADAAKRAGLFWLLDCNNNGAALDLRADAALLAEIFPGQEGLASDDAFWSRYFRLAFNSVIVGPGLTSAAQAQVMTSWTGALELFARRGADVVFLGSSETFHAIIPALLQRGLGEPPLRVLSLGVANMPPRVVALTAGTAAASGRKARLAIWGYSAWNAYRRRPDQAAVEKPIDDAFAAWRAPEAAPTAWRLPRPDWKSVIPFNLQEFWDRKKGLLHPSFTMPATALTDDAVLKDWVAGISESEPAFDGVAERDCDLTAAAAEYDAALGELLKASGRVLVYLTPTTPLQTGGLPACYLPAVRRMLVSRAGPRVAVHVEGWKDYGLDYRDYLKPSNRRGSVWIDINHVNYGGAVKVTGHLARWSAPLLR